MSGGTRGSVERSVTSPAVLLVCAFSTTHVRQFGFFASSDEYPGK